MFHKDQTTLIIVLAISGMLLLLLYSPWGSPDLYKKRVYFSENQGVNFDYTGIQKECMHVNTIRKNVGAIKAGISSIKSIPNAPKNIKPVDDNVEIQVEDNYSKRKKTYKVTNSKAGTGSKIIAYSVIRNSDKQIQSASTESQQDEVSDNFSSGSKSKKSTIADSGTISAFRVEIKNDKNQLTDTNVDLSLFGDSTVVQAINSPQKSNGSDPGFDNPLGEPIPVPDGWLFLLLLTSVFVFFKQKFYLKIVKAAKQ